MSTSKLARLRKELKEATAREKIAIDANDKLYFGPGQNGCPPGYCPSSKDYQKANLAAHQANNAKVDAYFAYQDELKNV